MTIQQKIKKLSQELNSALEAELILSLSLKISREKLITKFDKILTPREEKNINQLLKQRLSGKPLAYLSGEKSFYHLDFFVNHHTLIPRPESELIIDQVLLNLKKVDDEKKKIIIDLGTGSACLIITLAHLLQHKKNYSFWGVDISSQALKIAKRNAKRHQVDKAIKLCLGNLLDPLSNLINKTKNTQLIILANLPYLTKEEMKNSPSIKAEPRLALDGGLEGLEIYQDLWEKISHFPLNNNKWTVYQEINPHQKKPLLKIIKEKLVSTSHKNKIIKDLSQQDRLIITSF